MKSAALFATLLLATLAVSQAPTAPVVEPPGADSADVATVKPETVRGCLNSANDNYTVIDQASGKTYKIAGDTTKLKQYIGQMVEISGETQTVDGPKSSGEGSTGETLTLGDVREIAETCQPQQSKRPQGTLIAQRPVNDDANPNLNSAAPFSSNTSDTSPSARRSSTVTTRQQVSREVEVTGHAGQHQRAVDTSTTGTAGQTTPATNASPGGYNASQPGDSGGAIQGAVSGTRIKPAPAPGDAVPQPGARNPSQTGSTPEEGDRAAQAAGRAEMRTNPQTGKTTFSTMEDSQRDGTQRANPRNKKQPDPRKTQTDTNNEPK